MLMNNFNYIELILITPLIALLFTLIIPRTNRYDSNQMSSIISFIFITFNLFLCFSITKDILENIYVEAFKLNLWDTIYFKIDSLSIVFLDLTAITIFVCLGLGLYIKTKLSFYYANILGTLFLLNFVFTVQDLFGFFLGFESLVIPMFIIIGFWGSREEKVKAAFYFLIYTVAGSIFLLIAIFKLYQLYGTTSLEFLSNIKLDKNLETLLFVGCLISFGTKIPTIPFHIWLPLAHVEAPAAGSVLLAAILIKLGTFGLIKFVLPLAPYACITYAPIIITISIISIIYASFSTIRQTDLKRAIAYSSVAHMGVATVAIFSLTKLGIEASIFLQIAHGIVSSALFILVTILYNKHHTRLIPYYRGLTLTMPIFAGFFLFFNLCNIGLPLTGNFIGEFLSLYSTFIFSPIASLLAGLGVVLSACYALFLVSRIIYGEASVHIKLPRDLNREEFVIMLSYSILILTLGLFPNIVLDLISLGVDDSLLNIFKVW